MFGEVLADISLYVHARLGTLHKGKFDDSELLACGRVIYTGINKVSDPRFWLAQVQIMLRSVRRMMKMNKEARCCVSMAN